NHGSVSVCTRSGSGVSRRQRCARRLSRVCAKMLKYHASSKPATAATVLHIFRLSFPAWTAKVIFLRFPFHKIPDLSAVRFLQTNGHCAAFFLANGVMGSAWLPLNAAPTAAKAGCATHAVPIERAQAV